MCESARVSCALPHTEPEVKQWRWEVKALTCSFEERKGIVTPFHPLAFYGPSHHFHPACWRPQINIERQHFNLNVIAWFQGYTQPLITRWKASKIHFIRVIKSRSRPIPYPPPRLWDYTDAVQRLGPRAQMLTDALHLVNALVSWHLKTPPQNLILFASLQWKCIRYSGSLLLESLSLFLFSSAVGTLQITQHDDHSDDAAADDGFSEKIRSSTWKKLEECWH